jgi:hypothetical protein
MDEVRNPIERIEKIIDEAQKYPEWGVAGARFFMDYPAQEIEKLFIQLNSMVDDGMFIHTHDSLMDEYDNVYMSADPTISPEGKTAVKRNYYGKMELDGVDHNPKEFVQDDFDRASGITCIFTKALTPDRRDRLTFYNGTHLFHITSLREADIRGGNPDERRVDIIDDIKIGYFALPALSAMWFRERGKVISTEDFE